MCRTLLGCAIALSVGLWTTTDPVSAQSAAPAHWVCLESSGNDYFVNAPFTAPNDVATGRHARFAFPVYVQQQYGVQGTAECSAHPTSVAANAALQRKSEWARKQGLRIVATHWVYDP